MKSSFIILFFLTNFTFAANPLNKDYAKAVYSIVNTGNPISMPSGIEPSVQYNMGTCFVIQDSLLRKYLVTSLHLITTNTGDYSDSISIRKKINPSSNSSCSYDFGHTIFLDNSGKTYFTIHTNPNVEVVLIRITRENAYWELEEPLNYINSEELFDASDFIAGGTFENIPAELVGYSPDSQNDIHCPIRRSGRIILYTIKDISQNFSDMTRTAKFLIHDLGSEDGDSGAPIAIETKENDLFLIGINIGGGDTTSWGQPTSYICEMLDRMRITQRERKKENKTD